MRLFSVDSKFFAVMTKAWDFMFLSVLWLVFSLPVVTCGAATTALYYSMHKVLNDMGGSCIKEFWRSFRANWKPFPARAKNARLATAFFAWLKAQPGIARLRIEVEDDNEGAKRLYERMGFSLLPYLQMVIDKWRK